MADDPAEIKLVDRQKSLLVLPLWLSSGAPKGTIADAPAEIKQMEHQKDWLLPLVI